jgi:hypothetical protein
MAYNDFTLEKVRDQFQVELVESAFCAGIPPAPPSDLLQEILREWLPLAQRARSEKAKSELLVSPVLTEIRKQTNGAIELFSGQEFTVDKEQGLNGFCDFLISRSTAKFTIEAPVVVLVEAKKGDLSTGWGQCIAEMLAAQRFNLNHQQSIPVVYGAVTSGTLWQFLKLTAQVATIDVNEYPLMPVDRILGILRWMVEIPIPS